MAFRVSGTGPHPHPATHVSILEWVAGWGCGPVPASGLRRQARASVLRGVTGTSR